MGQWRAPRDEQGVVIQAEWTALLRKFIDVREENGKKTIGMFESPSNKLDFCKDVAEFLAEKEHEGEAFEATVQTAKFLLCERDEAIKCLEEKQCLKIYCSLALREVGKPLGLEALKCLNNALFDQKENQLSFCLIDSDEIAGGAGTLGKVLRGCASHHESFRICSFVCMYIVAGEQEPKGSGISLIFARAANAALLELVQPFCTTDVHGAGVLDKDLILTEEKKQLREAIIAGLKLLFAVEATQAAALATLLAESEKKAEELSKSGKFESLEEMISNLTISDESFPDLDRFGLLLVSIIRTEDPEESLPSRTMLDELKDQAVSVLLMAFQSPRFASFLSELGVTDALADMLESTLRSIMAQEIETPNTRTITNYRRLLPMVMAGNNLASSCVTAKDRLKRLVFPRELPLPDLSGLSESEFQKALNDRKMEGNTPRDCFGGMLISLLTCLDSNLKRLTGEFLYTLCNEDAGEMTLRCGFGSSAHILAIKGGTIGQIIAQQEQQQQERAARENEKN